MEKSGKIEDYGELIQIAPDLYSLVGEWEGTSFKRRMTVVRLRDGRLVIHSAIRLRESDYARLDALGKVAWIVVPNAFHGSEARFYQERYPEARLLVSAEAARQVAKSARVDGVLPGSWPQEAGSELECILFEGTRLLGESVFFHRPSRTLLLTDLAFNLRCEVRGFEKAFFRWNQIDGGLRPSRIFRTFFVRDRARAGDSFRRILALDFERVIVSHGEIQETGGKEALRAFVSVHY